MPRKCLPEERKKVSPSKEFARLVFVGSPLLDITTDGCPDLLEKYSLKPDDCIKGTGLHDSLFEELFDRPKSRLDAGGSALNSAKIARWVLGQRGHVAFAGCVGEDEYASRLFDELQSIGVEPLFTSLPENPTGVCACLLSPGGHRSMCTRLGAAAHFSKSHLYEKDIRERLDAADCIFVVGFFLSHSPEVVFDLADKCLPSQMFALSLSAEYICRDFKEAVLDVLPKVDILFGNEAEIDAFADAIGLESRSTTEEVASAIAKFRRIRGPSRVVIVTRGPQSVIFVRGEEAPCYFPVPRDVPVLDSVGCGDALAGAFLGVYALTGNSDEAVKAGIRAAVEIAQVPGCDPPPLKRIGLQYDSVVAYTEIQGEKAF